jgi:hypothetical protein
MVGAWPVAEADHAIESPYEGKSRFAQFCSRFVSLR